MDAADKTKLYITLDNMLDYLHVYRKKLKGSRVPFYQANFLVKQQSNKSIALQKSPSKSGKLGDGTRSGSTVTPNVTFKENSPLFRKPGVSFIDQTP